MKTQRQILQELREDAERGVESVDWPDDGCIPTSVLVNYQPGDLRFNGMVFHGQHGAKVVHLGHEQHSMTLRDRDDSQKEWVCTCSYCDFSWIHGDRVPEDQLGVLLTSPYDDREWPNILTEATEAGKRFTTIRPQTRAEVLERKLWRLERLRGNLK